MLQNDSTTDGIPQAPAARPGEISIDWLEFTILSPFTPERVPGFLGLDSISLQTQPTGAQGYKTRQNAGAVTILSDGASHEHYMGIHVVCPGSAIRDLQLNCLEILKTIEAHNSGQAEIFTGDFCPVEFPELARLYTFVPGVPFQRVKITRLDVAIDDFAGALPLPVFAEALKAGHVSCKAKKFGIIEGGLIATGQVTGRTYYLGKRGSNFIVRFYDKRQEQIENGENPDDLPAIWNRCELELRKESAQNFCAAVVNVNGEKPGDGLPLIWAARAALNNFMAVKEPTSDSNKSRWPVAAWWLDFIKTFDRLKLGKQIKKPTIEARRKWHDRQVPKTAAILGIAFGKEYIQSHLLAGLAKLTEKEIEQAETFAAHRIENELYTSPDTSCPACDSGYSIPLERPTHRACEICGQTFTVTAEMAA